MCHDNMLILYNKMIDYAIWSIYILAIFAINKLVFDEFCLAIYAY